MFFFVSLLFVQGLLYGALLWCTKNEGIIIAYQKYVQSVAV